MYIRLSCSLYWRKGFSHPCFKYHRILSYSCAHSCERSRTELELQRSGLRYVCQSSEKANLHPLTTSRTRLLCSPSLSSPFCSNFDVNGTVTLRRYATQLRPLHRFKPIGTRLIEVSPSYIQPYLKIARIDKPTGTLLLLWPCLWSIALAAEAGFWPSCSHLALFTLGAFLMRGAGCTINDMWDRDLDSKVERTKLRPLATGEIAFSDALGFLALQLGCATLVLLQLNWYSIILGCCSMGLVVGYPLAKRYTNWPQLVLGLTFNWGALLGWASVHGTCDWLVLLPLYAAGISWTLVYDTIYAHQDRKDDAQLGIKSTALLFGGSSKKWLSLFGCSMLANLALTGVVSDLAWPFFASTGLVGLHLATQIATLKIDNTENCLKRFQSNANLGLIIFIGIVFGTLLKDKSESDKKS